MMHILRNGKRRQRKKQENETEKDPIPCQRFEDGSVHDVELVAQRPREGQIFFDDTKGTQHENWKAQNRPIPISRITAIPISFIHSELPKIIISLYFQRLMYRHIDFHTRFG